MCIRDRAFPNDPAASSIYELASSLINRVDDFQSQITQLPSAPLEFTAGEALERGNVVYVTSSSTVEKASADTEAHANGIIGIIEADVLAGDTATILRLNNDYVKSNYASYISDSALGTESHPVYLSEVPGEITLDIETLVNNAAYIVHLGFLNTDLFTLQIDHPIYNSRSEAAEMTEIADGNRGDNFLTYGGTDSVSVRDSITRSPSSADTGRIVALNAEDTPYIDLTLLRHTAEFDSVTEANNYNLLLATPTDSPYLDIGFLNPYTTYDSSNTGTRLFALTDGARINNNFLNTISESSGTPSNDTGLLLTTNSSGIVDDSLLPLSDTGLAGSIPVGQTGGLLDNSWIDGVSEPSDTQADDAGKPLLLDSSGQIDSSYISAELDSQAINDPSESGIIPQTTGDGVLDLSFFAYRQVASNNITNDYNQFVITGSASNGTPGKLSSTLLDFITAPSGTPANDVNMIVGLSGDTNFQGQINPNFIPITLTALSGRPVGTDSSGLIPNVLINGVDTPSATPADDAGKPLLLDSTGGIDMAYASNLVGAQSVSGGNAGVIPQTIAGGVLDNSFYNARTIPSGTDSENQNILIYTNSEGFFDNRWLSSITEPSDTLSNDRNKFVLTGNSSDGIDGKIDTNLLDIQSTRTATDRVVVSTTSGYIDNSMINTVTSSPGAGSGSTSPIAFTETTGYINLNFIDGLSAPSATPANDAGLVVFLESNGGLNSTWVLNAVGAVSSPTDAAGDIPETNSDGVIDYEFLDYIQVASDTVANDRNRLY